MEGSISDLELAEKKKAYVKQRTQDMFYNNPVFQPLKADGSVNTGWDESRRLFLEGSGQVPEEEPRTLYNTPIIPYVKGTSAKDIVELGKGLIVGAAEGVNLGLEKVTKGAYTIVGALGGQTGSYKRVAEELTKGVLEVATGVTETGFAGATVVIPEFAALVGGADLIKKTAAKNLDKHEAEFIATAVDVPFASVSIMADKLGFDPKESPSWAMLMELGDLATMVGGHKLVTKARAGELPTPIKSLKDLQDMSRKVAEGGATREQKIELNSFVEAIAEATPADIYAEAVKKGTPESLEIAAKIEDSKAIDQRVSDVKKKRDELGVDTPTYVDDMPSSALTAVERVESGLPVDPIAVKDASTVLYEKYKELGKERENPKRTQTVAEIDAIRDRLGDDIDILEERLNKFRADAEIGAVSENIAKAEALGEELSSKPGLEVLKEENISEIDALKNEKQAKVDAEALRVEEEAIKQANRAELESALKDPEVSDLLKGKIKEQLEALKSEKRKEGVYAEALRKGEERDIEPVEAEPDGARADVKHEAEMREMKSAEEMDRLIAEKGESRVELAEAYMRDADRVKVAKDEIGRVIDEQGMRISLEEFTDNTGLEWKDLSAEERRYVDKDPSARKDIDTRMEEIDGTVEDFISHMSHESRKKSKTKVTEHGTNLRNRYRDITKKGKDGKGQELTPSEAKRILESEAKKIDKRYGKYIDKEYRSYEEAKRDYDEAIESGAIHIEGAETVSIPSSGKGRAEGKVAAKEVVKKAEPKVEAKVDSPKKDVKDAIPKEEPKGVGVKHKSIKAERESIGLPSLEKMKHMDNPELVKTAESIVNNNPEIIQKRLDAVAKGEKSTPLDAAIFGRYLAELKAKLEKNATNELLSEIDRVQKIAHPSGSEAGARLQAQKLMFEDVESLSAELLNHKESKGVDSLSESEITNIKKVWNEKEKFRKEAETLREEMVDLRKRSEASATVKEMGKSKVYTKRAKKLADKIRELKSREEKVTVKDEQGNEVEVDLTKQGISTNDLIELVALAVEKTGSIRDAIVDVKAEIKDKKWYKALSKENKDSVVSQLEDFARKSEKEFDKEVFKDGVSKDNVKDVNDLAAAQVRSGVKDLDAVAKNVAEIIGSDKVGVQDVIDVLAGEYFEGKTKSEFVLDMGELREEARLLKEIERLVSGDKKPVSERSQRDRSKIKTLKSKIKSLREDLGELDVNKIEAAINRGRKEIAKIQEKMDTREFRPEKRPILARNETFKRKYPEKMSELAEMEQSLYEKRLELEDMRLESEYENRGDIQRAKDVAYKALRTAGVTVAGIWDFSVALVHGKGAALDSPVRWAQSLAKSIPEAFSAKKFRERAEEAKVDEKQYNLEKDSGLAIIDLNEIKEGDKELQLAKTYYDDMKLPKKLLEKLPKKAAEKLGEVSVADFLVKPFQRQFVSMGNSMRRALFADKTQSLVKEGKTFETHPEEYKKVALMVNTLTGRAPLDKFFNEAIVNNFIWSPRKAAAAFNSIGLSDAYSMVAKDTRYGKANKGYYREVLFTKDKAVREEAMKTIASQLATGATIMAAAKTFLGAEVDDDPASVTYGNIIIPAGGAFKNDIYWDLYGDNAAAIRAVVQSFQGEYHLKGEVVKKSAGDKIQKVLRGRVTPIVGSVINFAKGTDYGGKKVTLKGEAIKNITPMGMDQIVKMIKLEGVGGILLAPSIFLGDKVKSQGEFDAADEERQQQKWDDAADPEIQQEKIDELIRKNRVMQEWQESH